ncbi:MAG: cation transporter [Oscillospiraceae bacterium]|nr:cation transporter [Oscillospiraceae bacterium]MBQ4644071.1 cation transporter [Oscillospiraceae bacterium]
MIYVLYLVVAALVTFMSIKASEYVDMLDKTTSLSGAFLGGILLSAVTSLPELFTSISSTLMLDQPGLCIGNILGSNLFNYAMLSFFILTAVAKFAKCSLAKIHFVVAVSVVAMGLLIVCNKYGFLAFDIGNVSVTSVLIILLYVLTVWIMYKKGGTSETEDDGEPVTLSRKQILTRFTVVSIGIVVFSVILTYITDELSVRLNLGKTVAGALFLGVATSLPETASTFTLFKIKNYDIAVGNIVGSCLFNFTILSVADFFYRGGGIYTIADTSTMNLIIFASVASVLAGLMLKFRNKATCVICPVGIIASYIAFLAL